jgi:hypothetical protein
MQAGPHYTDAAAGIILEVVSKPHLRHKACFAKLRQNVMLIPPLAGLRFLDRLDA